MFPRCAFSLEESYSLHCGRNTPLLWVETGISHPFPTLSRVPGEEWAPCFHESCRVAGVPHEPPPQVSSELVMAELFTGSNGFSMGHCLHDAFWFSLRHYTILTAELTSTTPLPWVITPWPFKDFSCQTITTIKLYSEHFSHSTLVLNLAHLSEEGLLCLKDYFSCIWQVPSKSYYFCLHFTPLL